MKKKEILILFVLTGLVLAGVIFVFSPLSRKRLVSIYPTPAPQPPPGWQIYKNEKYKFAFSYPGSWSFAPCPNVLCGSFADAANTETVSLESFSADCGVTTEPTMSNAQKAAICYCYADGPTGSQYCEKPSWAKEIETDLGLVGYSFYLEQVREHYKGDTEPLIERAKVGPFVVFFFPQPIHSAGLFYVYGLFFKLESMDALSEFQQLVKSFRLSE